MPHVSARPLKGARARRFLLAALAAATLAACAPQGDLGRPAPNVLNDELMPWLGGHAARSRAEPVSGYDLTDAERELRQLGYGLMMPTHPLDRWNQFWAELRRTRIGDPVAYDPDPRGYCRTLAREHYRSSTSRFVRMTDDMRADRQRIRPFCAKWQQVAEADRVRAGALGYIPDITPVEVRSARDRIAENRMILRWVRHGLEQHAEAYRCALHTQIVATPEPEAVMAERELADLRADIADFDRLCAAVPARGRVGVEVPAPGYYPMTPREETVISK